MTAIEETFADLWATGSSVSHPIAHLRTDLDARGVVSAATLAGLADRTGARVAGVVTHRQRPPTAGGVVFLSLEDETGLVNVVCPPATWQRCRKSALHAAALVVHGKVERVEGVVNLMALHIDRLPVATSTRSRDFR